MQVMHRGVIFAIVFAVSGLCIVQTHAATTFSDVDEYHPNLDSIIALKEDSVIRGFADGTFRAERTVNRAEAVKMITAMLVPHEEIDGCIRSGLPPYTDVHRTDWYMPYVCAAAKKEFIIPDSEGHFRPADPINLGELSAVLARSFELPQTAGGQWFAPGIRALGNIKAIPASLEAAGQNVSRGELAEMIWRLREGITDRDAAGIDEILTAECQWTDWSDIPNVDDQELSRKWLQWVNSLRLREHLPPYRPSRYLAHTAQVWSGHARDAGSISHTRPGQTAYYDYQKMLDWFESFDLEFENGGTEMTENIGWGMYSCASSDCTQNLVDAIRTTFEMYMREKEKASRPHYNSMVHPDFRIAGLGIAVDPALRKYYLTAHYAQPVVSDPRPLCP